MDRGGAPAVRRPKGDAVDAGNVRDPRDARIVIAGAGPAGAYTAASLRELGHRGPLVLLGEEPHPPYDRPPLSKDLLLGKAEHSALDLDLAGLGVELRLGVRATGLEPGTLHTSAGPEPYDGLVLATGAQPVLLPGTRPGPGVHPLRTHEDALALRAALRAGAEVVIVGAGWIGAEVATAARALGCAVTVLEAAASPLAGALPAELGELTRPWYAEAGAELRTSTPVAGISPGLVRLADATELTADAVVLGVGARPATAWLRGGPVPLSPDGTVRADDRLRAGLRGVYALGDCASFPSTRYGTRLTVQHWDNALAGARVAAANLLGADERYDPVPYFWSDQFAHHVQYAGHFAPSDRLLRRGTPGAASGWTVLWLDADGVPTALLAVDRPRDLAQGRRLLERATPLDETRAADPETPLKAATRR
jgi:3-phenylpropionate/trans-cinnamate dioxygenase ferredoxin reductase subunit